MNIKRQLKHKREAKIAFDNSRTSGKIHIICHARPFREIGSLCGGEYLLAGQKRMLFRKLAKNKADIYSLDSKLEKWADHFISF